MERVGLAFNPECVHLFNVIGDAIDVGFTGADNDVIVVGILYRPNTWCEFPDEEIVPRSEAVMLVTGVANICLVEIDELCRVIKRRDLELVERVLAKPACFFVEDISRFLPRQKDRPDVKHLLKHCVDFVVGEKCETSRRNRWIVDDGMEWEADHTAPLLLLSVVGSLIEEFVEQREHFLVGLDLLMDGELLIGR